MSREARYEKLKLPHSEQHHDNASTSSSTVRAIASMDCSLRSPPSAFLYAEIVGAILQSQSGCLSHWLPYLSHRDCQARSHLERLSYFIHNRAIDAETFYAPVVRHLLQAWQGQAMTLVLDTSMLWDQYCLIEVTLAWGGRSLSQRPNGAGTWQCQRWV